MPKTMKAAIVREFGKPLDIVEWGVPKVPENRILVKIEACGVCHTDLHVTAGDWPSKPKRPFIPGHEGVGFVATVGKSVKNVKEGDRVGVPWLHTACGRCRYCLTGWETLCVAQLNTGYSIDGCFAEYVLADPDYVARLPDRLSFTTVAPILCSGVSAYKGLKETDTKAGDIVVISGVGGLGHFAVQYAKAMGRHVIAVDIEDDKLRLAKGLGADAVINAQMTDPVAEVQNSAGGADSVLLTAASADAYGQASRMLRRGGTIVLMGQSPATFALDIFDTVMNRKTIRGSIMGTRMDLIEAIEIAEDGSVRSHCYTAKLEDVNTVLGRIQAGSIEGRVVLDLQNGATAPVQQAAQSDLAS